jgi:hypothetical protein
MSIPSGATIGAPGTLDGRNTQVIGFDPPAGSRVLSGSAITVELGCPGFYRIRSPVVPIPMPSEIWA